MNFLCRVIASVLSFCMLSNLLQADEPTQIDILRTDLHVFVSGDSPELKGEVTYIAIVTQAGEGIIKFNSYWLQIDSAAVNGVHAPVLIPFAPEIEEFEVALETVPNPGDTLSIFFSYTRFSETGSPGREFTRSGYYFFPQGSQMWNQTASRTLGYTMSQPNDARAWFPTIDDPSNKSLLTFRITVDRDLPVIANGRLESKITGDDGSITYTYRHDFPVPPYLMAFNVGEFGEYGTEHDLTDGRRIPVRSYLYDDDAGMSTQANRYMTEMLDMFEGLFGAYPFDEYGMIAIEPYRYGGMEHQTISTMRRSLFLDEWVIAHELAHQWWGNMVTCREWPEIWLNEGFASYGEVLYGEAAYGETMMRNVLDLFATSYFNEDGIQRYALYDPPPGRLFGTAIYRKGAWVLHMLRSVVGDEVFFGALREYGTRYRYSTASTEDLQNVFEEVGGMELGWFFGQWIYNAGYPVYRIETRVHEAETDNGYEVTVRLIQEQTNAPDVFSGPVAFRFLFDQEDTTVTFWNSERDESFSFRLSGIPDTVLFDPEHAILKRVEHITIIDDSRPPLPETIVLYQNYPNPFNAGTTIRYRIPAETVVRLRITDALGRLVEEPVHELKPAGNHVYEFNAGEYASGVYFIILEAGGSIRNGRMLYLR